jgi:glycosyltransferase involved in cell wall biosynthesis
MLRSRQFTAALRARASELDAILLRGPSPLLSPMAAAAGSVPPVLLLVGNYLDGVRDLPQPWWRNELILLWAKWNHRQQLRVARRSLTFVNSRKLFDELQPLVPNLVQTRTTTLSKADFFVREDTCVARSCRLLYSGRMDRAKGLLDMVEALTLLVRQGEDVVLDLVGWPEKGDPVLDDLRGLAASKGILDRVNYLGFKAVGPELFDCYKTADIFVIASHSEGFPRTIWEAMAHSLPVIATAVGSIPQFVGQAAMIIRPKDYSGLATAISSVIHDGNRRREMIRTGRELAAGVTLEVQVAEMASAVKEWLGRQKVSIRE